MADRSVKVTLDAAVAPYIRGITSATAATKAFAAELETSDARMANLVQSGLALGPALVPIGSTAVPAVAALSTQLGLAAAAAGVAVSAFNGVGEALDALNQYQLEPTAANFDQLQQAMQDLPEAAAEFVTFLDSEVLPVLDQLQDVAAQGVIPGAQDLIEGLLTRLPQVRDLVDTIAETTGDILSQFGADFESGRWDEFFAFLTEEARPALTSLAQTAANVGEGIAEALIGIDPVTDMVIEGIEDLSETFANLDPSAYRDFVSYVRDVGPDVADAIAATAEALLAVVKAAAPVGEVVLPVIETLAELLTAIAESPAGPVLIATAAGLAAVSRSIALFSAANASALATLTRKSGFAGALSRQAASVRTSSASIRSDITAISTTWATAGARSQREIARTRDSVRSLRRSFATLAGTATRVAGPLGAIALAASGATKEIEAANTVTLALIGTIAGPWGAAAGAFIGAVMDAADANNEFYESIQAVNRGLDVQFSNFSASRLLENYSEALEQVEKLRRDLADPSFLISTDPIDALQDIKNTVEGIFGASDAQERDLAAGLASDRLLTFTSRVQNLAASLGGGLGTLQETVSQLAPAMEALGISTSDFIDAINSGNYQELRRKIVAYYEATNSAQGRTKDLKEALDALDNKMLSNVESAEQLEAALRSLISPQLNLAQATDAWHRGLNTLAEDISEASRKLKGYTEAALDNRAAIRERVRSLIDMLSAQAKAGKSAGFLTRQMKQGREALIDTAVAAGFNRRKVEELINTYGLTPELVETLVKAHTKDAENDIKRAIRRAREFDRLHPVAEVDVKTGGAEAALRRLNRLIAAFAGKHVADLTVTDTLLLGPVALAAARGQIADGGTVPHYDIGGTVPGPRTPYRDNYPFMLPSGRMGLLAGGEEVITNRHGEADQFRADRAAGRIPAYADGGVVAEQTPVFPAGTATLPVAASLDIDYDRLAAALAEQRPIAVYESDSPAETAREVARRLAWEN